MSPGIPADMCPGELKQGGWNGADPPWIRKTRGDSGFAFLSDSSVCLRQAGVGRPVYHPKDSELPELPAVRVYPVTRGCGQEAKPDSRFVGRWGPPGLGSGHALLLSCRNPQGAHLLPAFRGRLYPTLQSSTAPRGPTVQRLVHRARAPSPSPDACRSRRQVILSLTLKINGPPRSTRGCVATAVFVLSCVWDFSKVV